jgi:Xaa-Pro dipeptidase
MNKIAQAQSYLKGLGLDGWLLYDFHKNNPLAHRFLEIPSNKMATRRFFYWIPVEGLPVKIVHAIETEILDLMGGEKRVYSSWQTLQKELGLIMAGKRKIAMEYSPKNAIPYVSKVDAGTVDFIRSLGVEVASSADFLLYFTSVLMQEQLESQKRAATLLDGIVQGAWKLIGEKKDLTERMVQNWIIDRFKEKELIFDPPIVAVNEHSADPHFLTADAPIRAGDLLLIDLWAKEKQEGAVWGDLTRVAVLNTPKPKHQEIFHIVREAQKAGIALVKNQKHLQGWQVDDAVRNVIRNAGHADHFTHRTGHSIEIDLHGSGTHIDNLEMHDTRPLLPMTCFSIEPGIYLPNEFGIRLESDVILHADGSAEVTGGEQDELMIIK